ncbi:MAG: TlpA family protein disulfide reductase [bacterium]|nr:TlpA family protein disulfide reductase [bacterium]
MRRIVLIAFALLAMCFGSASAADAPSFELKNLDGKKVTLKKLLKDNKIVVVDFWQVGCKPCNELLPHLQDYADEFKKKGVAVVIISRDTALTQSQVEPFFKSNKYSFPVLLDGDQEVSRRFGVKASPATFIIQPDGNMVLQHFGYKSGQEKEIKETIEALLAGKDVKEKKATGATVK